MYICKYCSKECINSNAGINHELRCSKNPDSITKRNKHHWNFGNSQRRSAWNKGLTKQTDPRIQKYAETYSKNNKGRPGKPHSEQTKEILSYKRSKILEEQGVGGFKKIKWYKICNILGVEFIVRGKWELKVANWLNSKNILWERKIYISYELDNKKRTYTPDFYLPQENVFLEVKGYFSDQDKKKLDICSKKILIKLIMQQHVNNLQRFNNIQELLTS